ADTVPRRAKGPQPHQGPVDAAVMGRGSCAGGPRPTTPASLRAWVADRPRALPPGYGQVLPPIPGRASSRAAQPRRRGSVGTSRPGIPRPELPSGGVVRALDGGVNPVQL